MRAIDHHAADRHLASQTRFKRRRDFQRNQSGEARCAEVPPPAADDEDEKREKKDRAAEEPAKAAPHRALPLPLPRRPVTLPLGRPFFCVHSDSPNDLLTTSQKIEIA